MTKATEKRLLKQAKEQSPVMVSGDALIKLLQEILRLRNAVEVLRGEVQANFDTMVEHIPCEMEGGIQFKVFNEDRDDDDHPYKRVTLPATGALVEDW